MLRWTMQTLPSQNSLRSKWPMNQGSTTFPACEHSPMNDPQSLFIVLFTLVVVAAVLLIYGLSNKDSGGFIGKLQGWSTRQQAGSRQASNESLKAKLDGET